MKRRTVSTVLVRPFAERGDFERMVDYFQDAEHAFLGGIGVDPAKLPQREAWLELVLRDQERPDGDRERFHLAWIYQGAPVGHSSVNKITIGEQAFIHLHLQKRY